MAGKKWDILVQRNLLSFNHNIKKITIKKFNSFFNKNFKVLRRMDRDCNVESETRHSPPLSMKIPFKWLFLFKLFEREQRLASLWTYLQCTYQLINWACNICYFSLWFSWQGKHGQTGQSLIIINIILHTHGLHHHNEEWPAEFQSY